VKKSVASDVLAGADLLGGALSAVLRNVDVNLPSIAEPAARSRFAAERTLLARRGRDLRDAVVRALAGP
jgi:formiminotetrahydrofolate cyclodeaminase